MYVLRKSRDIPYLWSTINSLCCAFYPSILLSASPLVEKKNLLLMCQGASKSNWNSAMSPPLFLPKFLELKSEEHSNILLNFDLLGEHDSFCLFFSKAQTRASKDGSTHPMLRDLLETHYGSHQFCISKKNILPAHVWSPICTKFKAPEVMSLQYLKSKLRKC